LHALRGEPSNRRMPEEVQQRAVEILSQEVYRGFRPTLATEYLNEKHEVEVSRETVRKWVPLSARSGIEARLWRPRRQTIEQVHTARTQAYVAATTEPLWGVGAVGYACVSTASMPQGSVKYFV